MIRIIIDMIMNMISGGREKGMPRGGISSFRRELIQEGTN